MFKRESVRMTDEKAQMVASRLQMPESGITSLRKVRCQKGKQCVQLCASETCEGNAAICADPKCVCRSDHRKGNICQKVDLEDLVFMTETKRQSCPKLKKQVHDRFYGLIHDILKEMSNIYDQIHQAGLNDDQKNFLKVVESGQSCVLQGKLISKILKDIKLEENPNDKLITEHMKNQLLKVMERGIENLKKQVSEIKKMIPDWFQHKLKLLNSKVILTDTERQTVTEMFKNDKNSRKVSNYVLLYRASENDFDTEKFWQKCDKKADTVTLIRTQFDKTIGAYTPFSWKKNRGHNGGSFEQDSFLRSFLFSVSEKAKFKLKEEQKKNAIMHNLTCGPRFGAGYDLSISNKANSNTSSFAVIGDSYENSRVQYNTNEGWQFFQGSKMSSNFKIKEWEVWQVLFE